MSAPKATATGTLNTTPLAELLVSALDRRLTGSLVFEVKSGSKTAVTLDDGVPVKARPHEAVAVLGQSLVASGAVSAAGLEVALAKAQHAKTPLGRMLVEEGLLESSALVDALREQLHARLLWLAPTAPECVWGFYAHTDFLAQWAPPIPDVEPLACIWRLLEHFCDPARVDAMIGRLGGGELRLSRHAKTARFEFGRDARPIVELLRAKPQSFVFLEQSGVIDASLLRRVIYALALTRHLELGEGGGLPVGVSSADAGRATGAAPRARSSSATARRGITDTGRRSAPSEPGVGDTGRRPSPTSPGEGRHKAPSTLSSEQLAEFRREVERQAKEIATKNYYDILGVERQADGAAIQAAFFQLARRWHPDRLPGELSDLREAVTRVFAKLSEAHQTLTTDDRRIEYDRLMREGGATDAEQETIQKVLKAATAFQRAEILVKKGDFAAAEKEASRAAADDPEQAEYGALLAFIQAQDPGRSTDRKYDDLLRMLNQAVKKQEQNMKIRQYRAKVLTLAGKGKEALRDYRAIVEKNPNNVEAAREIRLHEMRGAQAEADKSLLGKLFKR